MTVKINGKWDDRRLHLVVLEGLEVIRVAIGSVPYKFLELKLFARLHIHFC
jgi:hypothetical protein